MLERKIDNKGKKYQKIKIKIFIFKTIVKALVRSLYIFVLRNISEKNNHHFSWIAFDLQRGYI